MITRRRFLATSTLTAMSFRAGHAGAQAPAAVTRDAARPTMPYGVMSGDVVGDRAIVWSRSDRSARMVVEWSTSESFAGLRRVMGPAALETTDFTARVDLHGLPADQRISYRVTFVDLADDRTVSAPLVGSFRTPPAAKRDVVFAWSGDEAGQGWGINRDWGGMKLYEAMCALRPEFFIHSGDQIYADGPIQAEVKLDDGSVWKNLVIEEKSKVAETLREFRGNFAYNLLDDNKRRFAADTPFFVQWDDHEARNNWYPGQILGDPRYTERSASLLAARARRAMFEYNPLRLVPADPERIYRSFGWGPSLDVFMIDERSYRGPNTANRQTMPDAESVFLGSTQTEWLKQSLRASRATWKVIASDMPLGLVVPDGNPDVPKGTFEGWANADDGAPSGRELELAAILKFIKDERIRNVVWLTADVHYAAAHHYDPARAAFTEFTPFWEFVVGSINAGTFGPNALDRTFGIQPVWVSVPAGMKPNRPPSDGMQYFGTVRIDGASEVMTVRLHGLDGRVLYDKQLGPDRG